VFCRARLKLGGIIHDGDANTNDSHIEMHLKLMEVNRLLKRGVEILGGLSARAPLINQWVSLNEPLAF